MLSSPSARPDDTVVYLNGHLPVFTHGVNELAAFRLFTTQLIVNGTATQGEIVRAFGVSITTVKRGVKRYRAAGAAAFFTPPKPRQGRKLTPELLQRAGLSFYPHRGSRTRQKKLLVRRGNGPCGRSSRSW